MSRKYIWLNAFAVLLIACSATLVLVLQNGQRGSIPVSAAGKIAVPAALPQGTPAVSGVPTALSLPSLERNYQVQTGQYDAEKRTWTLSEQGVYYANVSQPANTQQGTTLIYGHATNDVFGALSKLKAGDTAAVKTDTGHTFIYKLVAVQSVRPDQSEFALDPQGSPRLILQTCSGFRWEKRQLYTFSLDRVEAAL